MIVFIAGILVGLGVAGVVVWVLWSRSEQDAPPDAGAMYRTDPVLGKLVERTRRPSVSLRDLAAHAGTSEAHVARTMKRAVKAQLAVIVSAKGEQFAWVATDVLEGPRERDPQRECDVCAGTGRNARKECLTCFGTGRVS